MLERWQFWVTTVVGVVVAVVAGYDMMLFGQNRNTQVELARRTQYIQQSAQLEILYHDLVKTLADLSARTQDNALSQLLASQGITFNTAATPAPASDATKDKKP